MKKEMCVRLLMKFGDGTRSERELNAVHFRPEMISMMVDMLERHPTAIDKSPDGSYVHLQEA